ncbi:cytokinesis protein 3 [Pseudogymnoascus destructans]|nr:cytokinesis protein 3 [Pseudogymnoascus destructans]OAF62174.1 cytokinesis protein 3 [Pseudogymnoascus destructans]
MALEPPGLPSRFPCWCRAVYSWGGESKRDLGFIEGDLIECLNAGDGSWWMGRLRRDKRVMGLFPSNFVQVLDDSFQPASRATSPMPDRSPSPNPYNPQAPKAAKEKPFRKPFQAYAAPDLAAQKRAELKKQESISIAKPKPSPSKSIHGRIGYVPSPKQIGGYGARASPQNPQPTQESRYRAPSPYAQPTHEPYSRAPSPYAQPAHQSYSRAPSPCPPMTYQEPPRQTSPYAPPTYETHPRGPSPRPQSAYQAYSRQPSPCPPADPYDNYRAPSPFPDNSYQPNQSEMPSNSNRPRRDSSPPPLPPPHRHTYAPHTTDSEPYQNQSNNYHTPRATSPCPPSPGATGLTPSPLRNAMDDVMSSLEGMGLSRETETPEPPLDPWSPEAFDETYSRASRRNGAHRPATSMDDYSANQQFDGQFQDPQLQDNEAPQLSNYVQRMESRLRQRHPRNSDESSVNSSMRPPTVPPKFSSVSRPQSSMADLAQFQDRPKSSMAGAFGEHQTLRHKASSFGTQEARKLRHRKSAYEVGKQMLGRTFTANSTSTNSSSGVQSTTTNESASTQLTDRSIMSGHSAGAFSATSAGSLARKKDSFHVRTRSALGMRGNDFAAIQNGFEQESRSQTPISGVTYHSSHASGPPRAQSQMGYNADSSGALGGLMAPKPKKSGFFKKIIESAKTGAASTRKTIVTGEASRPLSSRSILPNGVTAIAGGLGSDQGSNGQDRDGSGADWVQVRRDVNRSNSLSRIERLERKERCQMMDYAAISPVDELYDTTQGDEAGDGTAVMEPTNYQTVNLSLVDKNSRFIGNLPQTMNPSSLATGYICRPYRSDVQRLRAIFTWVAEKISWEEDFDGDDPVNSRRVIQSKRGSPEEVSVLVMEMCSAVGIHCEVVRGYLKSPGEASEVGLVPRSNHWWNTVLVDNEWRMMDCSLASSTNPLRSLYSSTGPTFAESWYFLARPMEICWTHVPEHHQHQHLSPPVAHDVLLALPCACPPFFKNDMQMQDFNTSLLRLENLELAQVRFTVPADVECVAEVETRAFKRDIDGDVFESGEIVKKRALAQAEWVRGTKQYTIKALLPGDEGSGNLKIYAGKRGLMHSIKDIPHPIALSLPINHTGSNPAYEFLVRHPTPHAQRHDLYVAQPQCQLLAINNTFVFAIRQHPSSIVAIQGTMSPVPYSRPESAMSLTASSASGSNPSTYASKKPAKLAIQSPSGKVLRLMRKEDCGGGVGTGGSTEIGDGGVWETIIKCGEKGVWRGLVLADRSARWCVFAEWTCA